MKDYTIEDGISKSTVKEDYAIEDDISKSTVKEDYTNTIEDGIYQ